MRNLLFLSSVLLLLSCEPCPQATMVSLQPLLDLSDFDALANLEKAVSVAVAVSDDFSRSMLVMEKVARLTNQRGGKFMAAAADAQNASREQLDRGDQLAKVVDILLSAACSAEGNAVIYCECLIVGPLFIRTLKLVA